MMHMYACSAVLGKAFQSYYTLHSSLTSSFSRYITGRGVARDAGPDVTCFMWTQSMQLADCRSFFPNHFCLLVRQKNDVNVAHGTPVYESTRLSLESAYDDLEPAVVISQLHFDESSIADPVPSQHPTPPETTDVTYRIVSASCNRGGDKLFDSDGYAYTVKRRNRDTVAWRCTVRNKTTQCAATVRQSGDSFIRGLQPHNHQHQPGGATVAEIVKEIKTTSKHRAFESAFSVVDTVLRNKLEPCALPKYDYLVRKANYNRQKVS